MAVLVRSAREEATVPPAWIARVRHLGNMPERRSGVPRWAWVSACAALLVTATAMLLPIHRTPVTQTSAVVAKPGPAFAEPEANQTRNSAPSAGIPAIIRPQNDTTVGRNVQVQWQRLPEALGYEIRILNEAGDTVWQANTNADHVQVPTNARLAEGQKYFVLIGATLPNGKTVHAKTVSFLVRAQESR